MAKARALRQRVEILQCTAGADGWSWRPRKTTWARVEKTGKLALFSRVGAGQEGWRVTLRAQPLTLHEALRWKGKFLFLSDLTEPCSGWLEAAAVQIEPWAVTVVHRARTRNEIGRPALLDRGSLSFPACVVEKYVGFTSHDTHAASVQRLVAICPKAVEVRVGQILQANGVSYQVRAAHTLDPYKNEYEIIREADA